VSSISIKNNKVKQNDIGIMMNIFAIRRLVSFTTAKNGSVFDVRRWSAITIFASVVLLSNASHRLTWWTILCRCGLIGHYAYR